MSQDFISQSEYVARRVLDGDGLDPTYEAGMEFMSLATAAMGEGHADDIPSGLYLMWGELTDQVDAPGRGSPSQDEEALANMKRAAGEWLEVLRLSDRRQEYLDRWVYEECGH